mgnify:CR=1 FL=1
MELIKRIETMIAPVLKEENVQLWSCGFKQENGMKILEIAITFADGDMDSDTCASVAEKISEILDEEDPIDSEYYLEVCSAGAERPLTSMEQIMNACGQYVHVDLLTPYKGMDSLEGYLESVEIDTLKLEYMDKASKRHATIAHNTIQLIRLAVKM